MSDKYNKYHITKFTMVLIVLACMIAGGIGTEMWRALEEPIPKIVGHYLKTDKVIHIMSYWTDGSSIVAFWHPNINVVLQVFTALAVQPQRLPNKKGGM